MDANGCKTVMNKKYENLNLVYNIFKFNKFNITDEHKM